MTQRLEFLRHIHAADGVQVTVRLGRKWADRVNPGDVVEIAQTGQEPTAKARIHSVLVCRLGSLPYTYLMREHDPVCRTTEGLLAALRIAYPESVLADDTLVTALVYEVLA